MKKHPKDVIVDELWKIELNVVIQMLTRFVCFCFARSRLRRGPKIDPKLKNIGLLHSVRKEIKEHRREFQTKNITESFTDVINNQKPVLKKRFKIDQQKLTKHLKKVVNKMISVEALTPASDEGDDLKFLNESKSFIHDQTLQVNFEEKFKKELFMKTETKRMLEKEDKNFINFLPQNRSNKYNSYIDAKTKLKNNRIESMMNYKRHNEELQLLIESGFIDDPDNIKIIIDKLNDKKTVKQIEGKAEEGQEQKSLVSQETVSGMVSEDIERQLMQNIEGPEQTRDYSKVQEFIQLYRSHTEQQKLKASEDVNLLLKVKQYERNLFLSRYDQINFRFRGRVNFNYFKEYELLSYIKNETIEPVDLLQIYHNNRDDMSRFKVPIITPAIMSRIYSKTSTYRFSQNDENNHINMLNDPIFQSLESSLFRQLDKVSDELFCDAAFAYSKNHELQRGVLNVKKSEAIQKAIFNQTCERINRLREVDLGLLLRSLRKLPLMNNPNYNQRWGEVIEALEHRLPEMKQDYEWQSVMEFLTLLPVSDTTITLVCKNINFFKKYKWQVKETLFSFARIGTALINHQNLIDPFQQNKTLIILKQIVEQKVEQIKTIMPSLTINQLSSSLVIYEQLNKVPFGPTIPKIILNIAKKEIVNGIRMQKCKIYHQTIPTLLSTLSSYDYYEGLVKSDSKYIDNDLLVRPYQNVNILKYLPLKNMLPGRVFTFNSQLYFVYHEMAKLLQVEQGMLNIKDLSDSLFRLSLVQYKNQEAFDTLTFKVMEKVEQKQRERQSSTLHKDQVINLMKIVNAYSLQKRNTDLVDQICDQILINGKSSLSGIPLNIMIRFFGAYFNIFSQPTELPKKESDSYQYLLPKWQINSNLTFAFLYCFKNYMTPLIQNLEIEELITIYFVQTLILNNINRIILVEPDLLEKYQKFSRQAGENLETILKALNKKDEEKIKGDYRFVLALCIKLNKCDFQVTSQLNLGSFEALEKKFYDRHIQSILKQEEHVGVVTSYKKIYEKISKKLKKEAQNVNQIQEKLWRIEDQKKKTVYFFGTFEHLMAKQSENQTLFGLFGLWKIYSQFYRRQGWKVELICTMLEQ